MKKILIIIIMACSCSIASAQDTIHVDKVLVVNVLRDKKTGRELKRWYRKMTVKKGYIIREPDGMYVINGRALTPDNFKFQDTIKK